MDTRIGVVLPYRATDDLIAFVRANLDLPANLEFAGAQDGFTDDELRKLSEGIPPGSFADVLADGTTVFLTHEFVAQNLETHARRLLEDGCDAVMICCSMDYPELDAIDRVITPSTVLKNAALAILPAGGTLGVVQPLEDGKDFEIQHWQAFCRRNDLGLVSVVAAPELPGEEAADDQMIVEAVRSLVDRGADVIALDCMSFTDEHRNLVAQATGNPTLRPMSLTGSLIAEAFLTR
jgi:protein AroM